jgi:Meiotically up-regulated gene 113
VVIVITKEQILSDIRRLGKQRGGHISLDAFLAATGMKEHQLLGKFWARWNDAITEAGLRTMEFGCPRTEEETVIEAFAQLIETLKKWPTETELRLERGRNESFPGIRVLRRVRNMPDFVSRLSAYCIASENLSNAAKIAAERIGAEEVEPRLDGHAPINGYVYMMRSGRRYKIGHTTSPSRRHREVRLDLPDPTILIHAIPTDDPAGIESYWHLRFSSKRVRDTEFFTLDASDVAAFKRRKYQ